MSQQNKKDSLEESSLNNAEKIILLLLAAQNQQAIPANLWLQKQIFLIADELDPLSEYLEFEPHLQGPFSETVNNISENLQYLGLVQRDRKGLCLTKEGQQKAQQIKSGSADNLVSLIENTKSKLNDLSKDELLVYVYYTYPEMTTSSMEKVELEENRLSAARSLFERNKVDLQKAAELAGLPIAEFKKEL